jgi:acetyl-CoA C-acetyltransferase
MGNTAENVAEKWQITREQQDEFATGSPEQGRGGAEGRQVQGRDRRGDGVGPQGRHVVERRIHPSRRDASKAHGQAAPAFDKDGTVTAGNASGINDGAAAVVLMTAPRKPRRGIKPLARIASWASPASIRDHGHGPDPGFRRRWRRPAGRSSDLDLVEANEAFAAQACAVNKDMGWDTTS